MAVDACNRRFHVEPLRSSARFSSLAAAFVFTAMTNPVLAIGEVKNTLLAFAARFEDRSVAVMRADAINARTHIRRPAMRPPDILLWELDARFAIRRPPTP